MRLLLPVLGGILLLVLIADVFLTVFHPAGRGGPINRYQNRGVWSFFRAIGMRLADDRRGPFLVLGGPTLIVLTLIVWVVLLVTSFALVYYPFISDFLVSPGGVRSAWAEALYYSGYTAATLGLGDVVADQEELRLLTVVQAVSGFALVSVSTTYLLAVYRELIAMHSTAGSIAGFFRSVDVEWAVRGGGAERESVARWAEGITASLLRTLQAHFQYPILHYFRSSEPSRALPVQLRHLLELRDWIPAGGNGSGRSHPSFSALIDTVEEYLQEVQAHFIPEHVEHEVGLDDAEIALRRLQKYLCY